MEFFSVIISLCKEIGLFEAVKTFFMSQYFLEIKIDPEKLGYTFTPEKLNKNYSNKSMCISLKITNKVKSACYIKDIYITDTHNKNLCRHDPNYNISFNAYSEVMTKPIPQDCCLDGYKVISNSVCIPDVSKIDVNNDCSIDIKLHIITTNKSFVRKFRIHPYREENKKGDSGIGMAIAKPRYPYIERKTW